MKKKNPSIIIHGIFSLYLLILFRITVFRTGFGFQNLLQNGTLNLTLFQEYIPLIRQGQLFRFFYLFVGNIIWFLPLGSYLIWTGKTKKQAIYYGLFVSFSIESLQYLFGTGISELDDLILNTFGTWIGASILSNFL